MSKTYRSDALGAIHETASDLHDAGLMDKRTLRKFDELCLTPVRPMQAGDIRALRERERVSQARKLFGVFTLILSASNRVRSSPVFRRALSASGSAERSTLPVPRSNFWRWFRRRACRPLPESSVARLLFRLL